MIIEIFCVKTGMIIPMCQTSKAYLNTDVGFLTGMMLPAYDSSTETAQPGEQGIKVILDSIMLFKRLVKFEFYAYKCLPSRIHVCLCMYV